MNDSKLCLQTAWSAVSITAVFPAAAVTTIVVTSTSKQPVLLPMLLLWLQISKPQPAASVDSSSHRDGVDDAEASSSSAQPASSGGHKPIPDGQKLHVQGQLLILAVGNGRQAGGGMRLCPHAGAPFHAHMSRMNKMGCCQLGSTSSMCRGSCSSWQLAAEHKQAEACPAVCTAV